MIFEGTISNGYNFYNINSTFISPIYTFPWRETYLFTRQIKVQLEKSTLIILFIKGKYADSGGKQKPFRPFLPSRTAFFPSFDGKVRVRSVTNGHQTGYSLGITIKNDIDKS